MITIVAKFLLSFLLLLVVANAKTTVPEVHHLQQNALETQPQIVPQAQASITPTLIKTVQNCSGIWYSYCYDCRTLIVCAGGEQPILQTACPTSAPYCDYVDGSGMLARCVVNMLESKEEQTCNNDQSIAQQRCTGIGYYPDANDPAKYYFCQGRGTLHPDMYTCPEGTIFDTVNYNCKRIIPYDCTGTVNEFVVHPINPAYYAYCRVNNDGNTEVIAYKCKDDQNFVYNLKTNVCEYQCKDEGHFVDREKCTYYYECYRTGTALSYRRISCSANGMFQFSKEKGACVARPEQQCENEVGYD